MKNKMLLALLATSVLYGCGPSSSDEDSGTGSNGDSGSSSNGDSPYLNGVVLGDPSASVVYRSNSGGYSSNSGGYVVGAELFLDLNFNGKQDPNEPHAVTDKNGEYSLNVKDSDTFCADASPMYVTIKDTQGDVVYSMSAAPIDSKAGNIKSSVVISPITTTVWTDASMTLMLDDVDLSCTNSESINLLNNALRNAETAMASKLGLLNNSEIYTDYVVASNSNMIEEATETVAVLEETQIQKEIAESSASESAEVMVVMGTGSFFFSKYKTAQNDDIYQMTIVKDTYEMGVIYNTLSDKLINVDNSTTFYESKKYALNETYSMSYDFSTYRGLQNNCEVHELYNGTDSNGFSISVINEIFTSGTDVDACMSMDLTNNTIDFEQSISTEYKESSSISEITVSDYTITSSDLQTGVWLMSYGLNTEDEVKTAVEEMSLKIEDKSFEGDFTTQQIVPTRWIREHKTETIENGEKLIETVSHQPPEEIFSGWSKLVYNETTYMGFRYQPACNITMTTDNWHEKELWRESSDVDCVQIVGH